MCARLMVLLCCLAWPAFAAPDDELGHAEFLRALGRSNAGDYQGAIKDYQAAYDLRPDKLQILLNIGDCLEHLASTATQPEEVLRYKLQALDEYKTYVELFEKYDPSHIRPPKGVVRIERLEREIEELRQQQREREEAAARRSEERVRELEERALKAEAERTEAQARVREMLSEQNMRETLALRERQQRERHEARSKELRMVRLAVGITGVVLGGASLALGAALHTRATDSFREIRKRPVISSDDLLLAERALRQGQAGAALVAAGTVFSAVAGGMIIWRIR